MSRWTLGEIAHCLGSPQPTTDPRPTQQVTGLCTDTRTLQAGSVFVPLVGENFDGHDYARTAVELGAIGLVWSRSSVPEWLVESSVAVFSVKDTTEAYQTLGLHHRKACGVRCVGITGSVGKTTTKEFLAHLLAGQYRVHKSSKNFNNDIGVPLTLLDLEPSHDLVIVEMGMRGPGQIARLVRASEPEVGVITGIGTSHLELLGSREAIAGAKGELVAGLPSQGRAVLPAADDFYDLLKRLASAPVLSYCASALAAGEVSPDRVLTEDHRGTRFVLSGREYHLGQPGRHHLHDLMAALAAGIALGADLEAMLERVASLENPEGRSEWIELLGARVYLDAYNSAPESLRAALSVLAKAPGRKVAVLGDMLELGAASVSAHQAIGRELRAYGVELVLCVGPLSQEIVAEAKKSGLQAHWFPSKDELANRLAATIGSRDTVLVKASRGLALETVVHSLKEGIETS